MAGVDAKPVFAFTPGGAAHDTVLPSGPVALTDITASSRFGLKGDGSAAWLATNGISLPAVNRIGSYRGMRVLRLGNEDILLLAEDAADALAALNGTWRNAVAPKGYSSWREECWAWMRISGPATLEAMNRLCALDLRAEKFGADDIAQTRVGQVEAVAFRSPTGFDVLFEVTASAYFARTVAAVATHCTELRHA